MTLSHPFRQDPSATAAFAALQNMEFLPREKKPLRAVVIGGGTGAPVSIRALLRLGLQTNAVVAMADDGGSTGILREKADVTPPGDIRKCIAAFARDPQDPLTQAFKCRFEFASGHTLGNLMLAALEATSGSFPEAIRICENILDAQGHVYPSTLDRVVLAARTRKGAILRGQANASRSNAPLERVWLESEEGIKPYTPALEAIQSADFIVLGPGSLFTSLIPNLLIPGVIDAIRLSHGSVLFVCSLADIQGETQGMQASEHFFALMDHGMQGLVDYVLVHAPSGLKVSRHKPQREKGELRGAFSVKAATSSVRFVSTSRHDIEAIRAQGPCVIVRDLANPATPFWHDPQALCDAFSEVLRLCHLRQK